MLDGKTELILIRHGETYWNADRRMQGQQDSPLTARGRAQAQAVADRLRHETIHHIYASDLQRVLDTARPLADHTGYDIQVETQLRERAYGIFEGLTFADAEREHPEVFAEYSVDRYAPDFAIPGAETVRQLSQRGQAILQVLAERHPGERVAVFSHGGLLAAILRHTLGVPLGVRHSFSLANGSLSRIEHAASKWQVVTLGDVCHLHQHTVRVM
ncbi:MAG: histidine phosphatase family protein [Caldilineaceae bacterium]